MCNDFVKQVREDKIKQPNQSDFGIKQWANGFIESISRDSADKHLYQAGKWFCIYFKLIQEQKDRIFENMRFGYAKENLLKLQVGAINYLGSQIVSNYLEELHDASVSREATQTEISKPAGVVQGFISTAHQPIAWTIESSTQLPNYKIGNLQELQNWLNSSISLGCFYNLLEDIWNKCVWNNWYIDKSHKEFDLVRSVDTTREEIYQIGLHRWESVFQIGQLEEWHSLPLEVKRSILAQPSLSVSLENDGKEIHLGIRNPLSSSQVLLPRISDVAASLFIKQDFYPGEIFEQPLPRLLNLTLSQLLRAWRFVSTMGIEVQTQLPKIDGTPTLDNLLCYSPTFSRTALMNLMGSALSLEAAQVSSIIELLTFRNEHDDLWHRPLIKVDDEKFTMVVKALLAPNLSRPVSKWMKEGGLDIGEKGNFFEQFAREKLRDSNQLSNAEVYLNSYKLRDGRKKKGDIDLILRIGTKVIIGQLKCSLFPSSPKEIHEYYNKLNEGADQANQAVRFVMEDLKTFLRKTGFSSLPVEKIKLLPLVVSNLPLATGLTIEDVPVIDLRILEQYLKGGFTPYSRFSQRGLEPLGVEKPFYSSKQEAENGLEDYLSDPPQIQELHKNLRWDKELIPISHQAIRPARLWSASVELPEQLLTNF